jgi:hypothetical protein
MSAQVITDPDTGQRSYPILEATPPRRMWSLTTLLGCGSNKALVYHAGVVGVRATIEAAHTMAQEPADPTDFGYRLESFCGGRFGRTKEGFIRPPHLMEWGKKADTGSAVHNWIERDIKFLLGDPTPLGYDLSAFTPEQAKGFDLAVAAWHKWKERVEFTPLASESVVWQEGHADGDGAVGSPVRGRPWFDYACRIDLAATIQGQRGIWDVKTGKLDAKTGQPYPSMWLQVEAQRRAANARNLEGGGFDVAGILHVPAAGGPVTVHSNLLRDRDADFAAFDHLSGYARWLLGPPGAL